jgi:nitrite reductase/ring-hydroxylating ferredoxin subunit
MNEIKRVFVVIFTILLLTNCSDDDEDNFNGVPIIPTNLEIDLDLPAYNQLLNPGGWAYINGGSQGIVVYRIGLEDFSAFDRHCTYRVTENCRIEVTNPPLAIDSECCESEFELVTGVPSSGPATQPLRTYNTQFNPNNNVLRIFN